MQIASYRNLKERHSLFYWVTEQIHMLLIVNEISYTCTFKGVIFILSIQSVVKNNTNAKVLFFLRFIFYTYTYILVNEPWMSGF